MNEHPNTWNLPWQALQRRLAVEPRAASTADSWLARARTALPLARHTLRDFGLARAGLEK